ncbi:MAG: hypothetical protein IPK17_39370 [Chloroflexi bacterium]|nr:hypothetical protein [Chloroflexota bacterium]
MVGSRPGACTSTGVPLRESYFNEAPRYSGHWEVGANQYFILGDNRNPGLDSGFWPD